MGDYIVRATAGQGLIRAFAASTKDLVNEAILIHGTSPIASLSLGRLLTGTAMMGCMLKNDSDILTVTLKGDGPMGGVVATADSMARVKGYVHNPDVAVSLKESGKLDVGGALGLGTMTVVKDMGLKEPMVGQVPLVSGEVADDLTYYFAKSEQIPSCVSLGVLLSQDLTAKQAGGFLIQMMPGATDELITLVERKLPALSDITKMLDDGLSPEEILEKVLGDCELKIHERVETGYYCNCSRQRVLKALVSVGENELKAMIEEDQGANVHCHFCNTDYDFNVSELTALLQGIK